MKIAAVECLVLDETYPFVMVRTDEGITGYGETFRRGPYVQKAAIDTIFEPLLIGKDPFDTERLWQEMFKAGNVAGPSGALQTAAAAIDIALWDIKGKALGVPLYRLLGGKAPRQGEGICQLAAARSYGRARGETRRCMPGTGLHR
ncbi:MAG: hypothetical protein IIB28_09130, partial [Chloroflexi bacterium]|nr:hypothetical protein [Chloroflexota bacterium]